MPDTPFDREAVIAENAAVRRELLQAVEGVDAGLLRVPAIAEWSVADVLAHLAGAQAGYAEALECIARGEPPRIADYGPPGPPHEWNGRVVAAARSRSEAELLAALAAAAQRHRAAVRAVAAESYAAPQAGFPNSFSAALNAAQHYADCARHERQHVAALNAWRREGEAP